MTDPVALLPEYVRIDTSNPLEDCREETELLCGSLRKSGMSPFTFGARPEKPNRSPMGPLYGALETAVLAVHPDAVVMPYIRPGFTDSRFFRSISIPSYGLMPVLLPHAEHGNIHGVDERIPLTGIAEMREIVYALVERWNA